MFAAGPYISGPYVVQLQPAESICNTAIQQPQIRTISKKIRVSTLLRAKSDDLHHALSYFRTAAEGVRS